MNTYRDEITVTNTPTLADADRHINRVTLYRHDKTVITDPHECPIRVDGFHWQFSSDAGSRIYQFCRDEPVGGIEAVGVRDGDTPLRGYVTQIAYDGSRVEAFVKPPLAQTVDT